MRWAAARAARRRGSSTTMRPPPSQGSSSSRSGTIVVLPAPGGVEHRVAGVGERPRTAATQASTGRSVGGRGRGTAVVSPTAQRVPPARGRPPRVQTGEPGAVSAQGRVRSTSAARSRRTFAVVGGEDLEADGEPSTVPAGIEIAGLP